MTDRIPRIVHYSWLSGEPFPDEIMACMSTWKKHLPEYEFILWDKEKLSEVNNIFANEAISVKKWAFASDFIRLYAVYKYGGIWLDTDVEIYKSFDSFLYHRMFIGREANEFWTEDHYSSVSLLTSHCFGAESGHPFLKYCLDFYENRHFIRTSNEKYPQKIRYDMFVIPRLMAELALQYGYDWTREHNHIQKLKEGIVVYPHDYFDRPKYIGMDNVVCIHRMMGAWRPNQNGAAANYRDTHDKHLVKKFISQSIVLIDKLICKIGLKLIPVKNV